MTIQVDGINMQGATHHEAVSALRNVGSCMEMKVVRERLLLPREVRDLAGPQEPPDVTGRQPCSQDGRGRRSKPPKTERAHCLSEKIEAVVCNGKVSGLLPSQNNHNPKCPLCFTKDFKPSVDYYALKKSTLTQI